VNVTDVISTQHFGNFADSIYERFGQLNVLEDLMKFLPQGMTMRGLMHKMKPSRRWTIGTIGLAVGGTAVISALTPSDKEIVASVDGYEDISQTHDGNFVVELTTSRSGGNAAEFASLVSRGRAAAFCQKKHGVHLRYDDTLESLHTAHGFETVAHSATSISTRYYFGCTAHITKSLPL
jgi:hypothetical protein